MSKTCIIVPCYNEEKRLNTDAFRAFAQDNPLIYFCFVNDGSSDDTLTLLRGLEQECAEQIMILSLPANAGKAEAVRCGMLHAAGKGHFSFIGYMDADLATPLSELRLLHAYCVEHNLNLIFGSRVKRWGAFIERNTTRHYLGRFFATLASLLFRLPIYDTQCGMKIFSVSVVNDLFVKPFCSRWIFDVELFVRYKKLSYPINGKVYEMPLMNWEEKKGSKVSASSFLKAPLELYRIWRQYE